MSEKGWLLRLGTSPTSRRLCSRRQTWRVAQSRSAAFFLFSTRRAVALKATLISESTAPYLIGVHASTLQPLVAEGLSPEVIIADFDNCQDTSETLPRHFQVIVADLDKGELRPATLGRHAEAFPASVLKMEAALPPVGALVRQLQVRVRDASATRPRHVP